MPYARALRDVASHIPLASYRNHVHQCRRLTFAESGNLAICKQADRAGRTVFENNADFLSSQRVVFLGAGELDENCSVGLSERH